MTPVTVRQPDQPAAVAGRRLHPRWARRLAVSVPYLLALLFFSSALYRVNQTEIIDTDAARHAMNGAFIYDLIRTGHIFHPIAYGKFYYSRLPALSLPFHPPLFPAIEAVFFALFGVHLLTARVAVAFCVAIAAILLYRLVLATTKRPMVAACVTLSTLSLWTFLFVARDVMLEYPALVFSLAALYCLRDLRESYPMRRAMPFAIFAAAALWTKQHTVFLGAVPFIQIALSRRWRRFLEWPLWISSALLGVAVLAIIRFSRLFHSVGIDQISTSGHDFYYVFISTLPHYFSWIQEDLWGMPGVLLVSSAVVSLWGLRHRDAEKPDLSLYVAWALAVAAVLLDLGLISARYLFFLMPAAMAIGFIGLFTGCRRLWGERSANIAISVLAAGFLATGTGIPFDFLRGPEAAARMIATGQRTRVLYAGDADGNFIFAVREFDPTRQVIVIPAAKISRALLQPTDIAALCQRYGIAWVVFENTPAPRPWSDLKTALPNVAKLERSIPLESSRYRWRQGSIDVYRFADGDRNPDARPLPTVAPR